MTDDIVGKLSLIYDESEDNCKIDINWTEEPIRKSKKSNLWIEWEGTQRMSRVVSGICIVRT